VLKALKAVGAYNIGKPLVVEEMFPLSCDIADLEAFVKGSRDFVDGYIGFYWGKSIVEYSKETDNLSSMITKAWLEYFQTKAKEIFGRR